MDEAITDEDLKHVMKFLRLAIKSEDDKQRLMWTGTAVRGLTRIWAHANPRFDGEAWFPISFLLAEHWDAIRAHMADAGLES